MAYNFVPRITRMWLFHVSRVPLGWTVERFEVRLVGGVLAMKIAGKLVSFLVLAGTVLLVEGSGCGSNNGGGGGGSSFGDGSVSDDSPGIGMNTFLGDS